MLEPMKKTDGATYLAEADETTPVVGTVEKTTDGYWAAFHGNGAHAGDFEARHMAVDHLAYLDSLGEGEAPKAFVDRFRK